MQFIWLTHGLKETTISVKKDKIIKMEEKTRCDKETGEVQDLTLITVDGTNPFYAKETIPEIEKLLSD
ncbi:hypothetical protein Q5W88_01265 [Shouchella clausii]|uniref:hypothetical protein n=1 Tax=Shouchella clausii TaxID=79880 RepID=UPI0026F428D9|nr:hypothetical protein [Shouchella clausii]MDO7281762.1 hypothetical protein [Shouchella clausii]MDO7301857.1 hypothetical protein [Shouchella clausii]